MARSKGSFGLAGAVEPKAAAPLDARAVVKNMGELTAVGSFPYPYIGMETYVVSENKKYRLIGNDPTVSSNWEEVGTGETGGGHAIEDPEGTALTQRDTLQFGGDLEVSDDDENEKTVVAPHELTAAELTEIVTPLPSVPVNMPILFDETGTERVVGWYKYANGTKKPVYRKMVKLTNVSMPAVGQYVDYDITNDTTYELIGGNGYISDGSAIYFIPFTSLSRSNGAVYWTADIRQRSNTGKIVLVIVNAESDFLSMVCCVSILYTKTTDTPT